MSGMPSKHWRNNPGTGAASCGRWLDNSYFVLANVEAVTCGNCLRSRDVHEKRREERRASIR